jgi:acyl-CoA reductase-like NAD-dependent aldehyde dehydrogenase
LLMLKATFTGVFRWAGPRGSVANEQVVETATAITSTLLGDKLEVARDMDTYSRRIPLGVCAAITPFNFPAM